MSSNPMNSSDQVMIGSATLPKAADPVKWVGIWLMAILIGSLVPSVSRSADYWVAPMVGTGREAGVNESPGQPSSSPPITSNPATRSTSLMVITPAST